MAASWLCINEVFSSNNDLVCVVARIQSINFIQRTLILHDENDDRPSSILHISYNNLRTPSDFQRGQYVQVYGKVNRQGTNMIRIDAQFIRPLGIDFDQNEYVKSLILTRNYMANVDCSNAENVVDINIQ